ncbi:MAG: hypothetical protein DWQ10_11330, partial [Calditrichaeota bacterium]
RSDKHGEFFAAPSFVFQTYQFPGDEDGKTRLEIKVGLVNDVIQFVKLNDDRYRAAYELTLDIVDKEDTRIEGTVVNREIFAESYKETNSRRNLNRESLAFLLTAGEYELHLDILDLDTRKHLKRVEKITVTDFHGKNPNLSSLVFLQTKSGQDDDLEQNLAKTYMQGDKDIFVRFVLSGFLTADSISIKYALKDWNDKPINAWQEKLVADQGPFVITRSLSEHIKTTGQLSLSIECMQNERKAYGHDEFIVRVLPNVTGDEKVEVPTLESVGFEPLKYIMHSGEFKDFMAFDSLQKAAYLDKFWNKRDPSPDTDKNELKTEFEQRLTFANDQFSVISKQKTGWKTDRGKIYIRFGKPDMIRNQTNKIDEPPLEIWFYRKAGSRFVFRDKKGDGDFELIHRE